MTSEEILEEISAQTDCIREFQGATFEGLEDYWAIADARLSAFSSDKMWAVVIEVIGFDRGGDYTSRIYLYGNCLTEESTGAEFFGAPIITVPNTWNKEIEENQLWGISRDDFAFRFRGKRIDFSLTLEDLKEAGIELSPREIETGELSPQQMLRYVCEKMEHPFFLSEDSLRDLLYQNATSFGARYDHESQRDYYENKCGQFDEPPILSIYLELILQTRDWVHPKTGNEFTEEDIWEVSPREAFETLSQVLATRDLTIWEQQDKSKFNSHWRNWAEIEVNIERGQVEAIDAGKREFRAFIESLPLNGREELLLTLRENIKELPVPPQGITNIFLEYEGKEIYFSKEVLDEIDVLLSELKNR